MCDKRIIFCLFYSTSLQDLAIKIEYPTMNILEKQSSYESAKFIRKMLHGRFKPELGQNEYDVVQYMRRKKKLNLPAIFLSLYSHCKI